MATQSQTISEEEASAMHLMLQVVAFAEAVRLVPRAREAGTSAETFNDAVDQLANLGVARHVRPVGMPPAPSEVARVSQAILSSLEDSPLPQIEWVPIADILHEDQLATLVGISASSLGRYRSGDRATPDLVAARLHFIAMIVADLLGSYNDLGVRLWFGRARTALGGSSPSALLTGDWSPDSPDAQSVRRLAHALLGAGAA